MNQISCVIVNFNNGLFLEKAICSVLDQSLIPDEIIIADDNSSDESIEIIEKYVQRYKQIKAIFRKQNLGAAKNRDLAIREASGKYVTTLDSDDLYTPDKIRKEYEAIKNTKDTIAISSFSLIDENENIIEIVENKEFCLQKNEDQLNWLIARKKGGPLQMMLPKELYIKLGGLKHNLVLYEDWDFKLRATASGTKWVHSGEVGYIYRRIGAGLSSANQVRHTYYKALVLLSNYKILYDKCDYFGSMAKLFLVKGTKYILSNKKQKGFT